MVRMETTVHNFFKTKFNQGYSGKPLYNVREYLPL